MLEYLNEGLALITNLRCILLLFGGTILGVLFGCVPGLTTNMCLVVMLPLSFTLKSIDAISLLMGIQVGGCTGGLISAILINIPGTPANICTTFDGHPMAKRGEAERAINISLFYSFLGNLLGFAALISIAPWLANFSLKFGYYEFFAIGVFSITIISTLISDSVLKGLGSAALGMALALIGTAPIDYANRLTFGVINLDGGIQLITLTIGLYAFGALYEVAEKDLEIERTIQNTKRNIKGFGISLKEFSQQSFNMIRSAIIGIIIGVLPGLGAHISNLVAYSIAKNQSKYPEKYGTGIIDGLVASETSNNATIGGAYIPLLTLGIPGDGSTALILATLIIHGIVPGPSLFRNQGDIVYAIFLLLLIASFSMLIVIKGLLHYFISALSLPEHILIPIIILLSVVGVFGSTKLIFDIWLCVFIGLLAFFMNKVKIPLGPLLIAYVITPIIEINLRRGLMVAKNRTFWEFFQSPIFCVLICLSILVATLPLIIKIKKQKVF